MKSMDHKIPDIALRECIKEFIVDDVGFKSERKKYYENGANLLAQFKTDLADELGLTNHPKWDKLYSIAWEERSSDDYGRFSYCCFEQSFHLNEGSWQVHYGETPPTISECSTSNDSTEGDTKVASSASLPANEVQDVTEEISLLYSFLYEDHTCDLSGNVKELLDKLKSGEYSVIHNTNIN